MIKVSLGTAHVLGFKTITTDALPTTAYLMSGEKCSHDCSFCPQARNAHSSTDLLSRVTWSEQQVNDTARRIGKNFNNGELQRTCIQVVDGKNILKNVQDYVKQIRTYSDVPICVSAKVNGLEEVLELADTGVERIGLALDAASERVFREVKTGDWQKTLGLIEMASKALPGRISTHLIVGLGETEEEMVRMMQHMVNLDVHVGLFAFTPVRGTKLEKAQPPELDHYRRMQVANYLTANGFTTFEKTEFHNGELLHFGLPTNQLVSLLKDGKAFETSGCPGCNRPYYNEKPGKTMYNYPRPLKKIEVDEAIELVIDSLTVKEGESIE